MNSRSKIDVKSDLQRAPSQRAMDIQDPVLDEIVHRLIGVYHPEEIYLFGSRARGEAGADSDYDLMIVVSDETPPSHQSSKLAYQAIWGLKASVDVLIWTRKSFDQRLHLRASLPSAIVREGKLLHAA